MSTVIIILIVVALFYFMYRSNKKQERETAEMRNSLEVGDEITTIGGIIGEIVKIKEETVTIETGKDRTKIRILRSAVRNVDVHAYEKRGDGKKPEPIVTEKTKTVPNGKVKVKQMKKNEEPTAADFPPEVTVEPEEKANFDEVFSSEKSE